MVEESISSSNGQYRLRLWRENRTALGAVLAELTAYIDEAFEDTKRRLRKGFEDDLSPFNDPATDPAANFPRMMNRITLQGYFGETLAVIAVEHWGAHNTTDWIVPAFLFRMHDQEFQHLEWINERLLEGQTVDPDQVQERRPGRTGDDGLAFRVDASNTITDILTLEAKCLAQNNNATIAEAHRKLAQTGLKPSGIRELINLLAEYDTPEANTWREALLKLWHGGYRVAIRHDGVAYACGHIPQRGTRIAWLPTDTPHSEYNIQRGLEGMEFQFEDLTGIVDALYRRP
ncbi:hypothetical protein HPT29_009595 [Microvirga terrae]|uniref:Ferritin-like domain-containing protein n=1 Tax=Microvirga terrae TaxID=2740529 RepID=A0ABY5RYJ9_9HYPH|nr:hypothetical protein [Microvirga terrae]UVF21351.1 hypothetical protein HPT29_009595 [Microvirga terrae]